MLKSILRKEIINDSSNSDNGTNNISSVKDEDIAVIGMGIKMPMADNIDQFWENIRNGVDCVTDFPTSRASKVMPFLNKKGIDNAQFMKCSYLKSIDGFDYDYFNLTPKEAELMDPLHRIFLETVFETLESAGYLGEDIEGSNTGVYIGAIGDVNFHTYKEIIRDTKPEELPLAVTGTMISMMGGFLAYTLNLKGPTIITDTACSSSLVSIHNACVALKNKECDMALACGARLHLVPLDDKCYKIGIESSDGTTRTFDSTADGSGYGEGFGMLLLKPLVKAKRDGDIIHAVIKGSAVNQDGTSLGLTSPNPDSQEKVLVKAWKNAKINPEKLSYIECHGTGTKLGDPIELDSIKRAFNVFTSKKQFCAVGSIKSNLGHLLDCSGIAGTIKAILALKYKEIPPTINLNKPNESINFLNSPIYPNVKLKKWENNGEKRYCGVSSFGISGVNCHIVLEEADNTVSSTSTSNNNNEIFVLSAKTKSSLMNLTKEYISFLQNFSDNKFENLCFTTNIGKKHYLYRIAIVANSCNDLKDKLSKINNNGLEAANEISNVWFGACHEKLENPNYDEIDSLVELCNIYVEGYEINWKKLYKNRFIRKIQVPTYQFDNKECWIRYPKEMEKQIDNSLDMFYQINYKVCVSNIKDKIHNEKEILVFSDNSQFSKDLVSRLKQDNETVYELILGSEFNKIEEYKYEINTSKDNYRKLYNSIKLGKVGMIIYSVCSNEQNEVLTIEDLKGNIDRGLLGLFNLIQSLAEQSVNSLIDLVLITDSSYEITGNEEKIKPHNASLVGFGRNVNLEFSNIKCKTIDKTYNTDFNLILNEIYIRDNKYFVAFRDNERYVEEFAPMHIESISDNKVEIHKDGVYIITGGLGNIGLNIGKYLSASEKVKLILVSRKGLPPRDKWNEIINLNENEKTTNIILDIKKIEAEGSQVVIYQADISKEDEVRKMISTIKEQHGDINGVVHAAGVTGNGYIATRLMEDVENVLNPKIYGTWLIDKYIENENLDFFMTCSSGVALIGEIGLADYTAANAYLDSFSSSRRKNGKYLTIDWVVWKNGRMGEGFSKNVDGFFKQLDSEKAVQCFDIALNKQVNRVLIGEIDYESKFLKFIERIPLELAEEIIRKVNNSIKEKDIEINTTLNNEIVMVGKGENDYSEVEKKLSKIVCEVLGYNEINIYDNFFELGGNSIILNYIWTEIDKVYPNKVMISDLFAYASIHKLSTFIVQGDNEIAVDSSVAKEENEIENEIDNLLDMLDGSDAIDSVLEQLKSL